MGGSATSGWAVARGGRGAAKERVGLGVARAALSRAARSVRAAMEAAAPAPRCTTPPEAEVKASFPARASAQRASAASSRVELVIGCDISANIAAGEDNLLGVAVRQSARLLDGVAQGGNGQHAATGRDGLAEGI